jgi:AraC-like DNA-binding protein
MSSTNKHLVARSLELLYARVDDPPTVAELAQAVGASESALSELGSS